MQRGYSLIELIIVCLIIGVVAGMGINAYINMRDDAVNRTVAARLQQLTIAKQQFMSEYGRLEAERIWRTPTAWTITRAAGQANTPAEHRYNYMKRYIERPQAALSEFVPAGSTLSVPISIYGTFTGRDNRGRAITIVK